MPEWSIRRVRMTDASEIEPGCLIRQSWEAEKKANSRRLRRKKIRPKKDPRVFVFAGRGANGEAVLILRDTSGKELRREAMSRYSKFL
jgi:hypothetical protein